ncbi:MAG: enoyl-CoA hydratase [Acidimicrobiia bacterium]|nr:enoyl-CoA hydratase [Acidimicrobiia bacterium]
MSDVLITTADGVATITLDRPERRNALSLEFMNELIGTLKGLDDSAEVVVIAGNGPAFSAGHDLNEIVGGEPAFFAELFAVCTELMQTIHRIPQPVIARVHGIATAAGCQLVASCDLAVAADTAVFATPGVKIGLFCSTPMVPISRAVGRKRAMQMLLTGEPIDASTAEQWGLINAAVPADQLDDHLDTLIAQIQRFSPTVIGIGKETFYSQIDLEEDEAYDLTKTVMAENAAHADAQEGMSAFLEKRSPNWQR